MTGSICAKALVRIDTSGIVRSTGDEQPNNADIGKIISLVNVDAGRLGKLPSILTVVFESPVRIFIGAYFLFDVLGFAGFVGYTILIAVRRCTVKKILFDSLSVGCHRQHPSPPGSWAS